MKTLIIYASKTGASEDVAHYISKQFENSKIVNASNSRIPNLKNYDKIILGTGIYFGKIHKCIKGYITNNFDELMSKDFGIYFTCGSTDDRKRKQVIDNNFCTELKSSAIAITCVGGKMNYDRAKFPNKIILYFGIKLARIKDELPLQISYALVDDFIEKMKNISKN